MPKKSLFERFADRMLRHQALFRCPVCHGDMRLAERRSLVCGAGHRYDLSRQRSIHFAQGGASSGYNDRLFEARRAMAQSGLFRPLEHLLSEVLERSWGGSADTADGTSCHALLDAGCGEGSHLAAIQHWLEPRLHPAQLLAVGLDLSKEGVRRAAKTFDGIACVGDLANTPFVDHSFDGIVNVLSPANYAEFKRLLRPGGVLLKVVPLPGYLAEVRQLLGVPPQEEAGQTLRHATESFARDFGNVESDRLSYTVDVPQADIPHLALMSPLAWRDPDKALEAANRSGSIRVSVELGILSARA